MPLALVLAAIDWTTVIVAAFGVLPGVAAAYYGRTIHQSLKLPSGGRPGAVLEQTRDLSAVTVAHTSELVTTTTEERATRRLNGEPADKQAD